MKPKRIHILLLSIVLVLGAMLCVSGCGDAADPNPAFYTVTWADENGDVLGTTEVEEGKTPSYTYTKADTAQWDYTVKGWSATQGGDVLSSLPAVDNHVTYYAVVTKELRSYTVHFNTDGGTAIPSQTIAYGSTVQQPEDPERENFRFLGWYTDASKSTPADFSVAITGEVTFYAGWVEQVKAVQYLKALLAGFKLNPYQMIPETMRVGYEGTLVEVSDIPTDYSSAVKISDITSHGFGEQWDMILTNLQQSNIFFNALSVVEGLTTTSIAAFNNYFDKNPSETAHHEFESGIYSVTISFDGEVLYYVLDYQADLPALGEQQVQIALSMLVESGEKTVRIQLGDANALTYTMTDTSYTFAIRYLGVRRAFFTIYEQDGVTYGHIYEYLSVKEKELVASAADFIITDEYVTAVGNKADGMIGFTGYITELYDVKTGRMIAYEVRETLKSIVYNTLWFDLDMFGGFTSIRYREATDDVPAAFFANGMTDAFENMKVGGLNLKTASRRFDIEFRTQYFYTYDASTEEYVKIKAQVPMLFIQEENYDTAVKDIKDTNGITLTPRIGGDAFARLLADYDTRVDIFIENKDTVTSEGILEFIGSAVEFK